MTNIFNFTRRKPASSLPPPTGCKTMIKQGDYAAFIIPYYLREEFTGMEPLEGIAFF